MAKRKGLGYYDYDGVQSQEYARDVDRLPGNPCRWGAYGQLDRIYTALGVKNRKIPKSMVGDRKIDGWWIRISPSSVVNRGTGKHRIKVLVGGRWVPAGRVGQIKECYGGKRKFRKHPRLDGLKRKRAR